MPEIPEIPLVMNPQTPAAKAAIGFKWNDTVGKAHKLGGTPDWIQGDHTPNCQECGGKMTFYGQLDCIGDDIALADCGCIYVFACFDCNETKSILQSY